MKVKIELVYADDGTIYIDYWDNEHGRDVIASLTLGGGLICNDKVVTLTELLLLIKEVAQGGGQ